MGTIKIPIGLEDFDEIRQNDDYYVDKSGLIYDLLTNVRSKVTLFTRPRRFGKTLNMRMMESFFDIRRDSRAAFKGLEVSCHEPFCREWMNQYPVLFMTFQNIEGLDFEGALDGARTALANVCQGMPFLAGSERVGEADKQIFRRFDFHEAGLEDIKSSLFVLCRMLNAHF